MFVLAGDIGATNSRLALAEMPGDKLQWKFSANFKNQQFGHFREVVAEFFRQYEIATIRDAHISIRALCFGVAGPVQNPHSSKSRVAVTNLPWTIESQDLQNSFIDAQIYLLNDLEATAFGLSSLSRDNQQVVAAGLPLAQGNQAILAPGSGLGEVISVWDGKRHVPFATEGGHCSFSPETSLQCELFDFLRQDNTVVSWEHLLSGPGLANLYRFFEIRASAQHNRDQIAALEPQDFPAAVTRAAVEHGDPIAVRAVDLFFEVLANEAGNLALKSLPRAGLFLAGGIPPRLSSLLNVETFRTQFLAKSRMHRVLNEIPIFLVRDDKIGMRGAALYARWKIE